MASRGDDLMLLDALDRIDRQGQAEAEVARAFGPFWGGVARTLRAVRADATPCACVRAQNRDGGMPARWWAE